MPKKKIVLDTTICIDLFHGRLLKRTTELPYELLLPDVIVEELINPPGEVFTQSGFFISQVDEDSIGEIFALREHYPKPSTNDLFALLLAKINSCPLITGDDALRKAAKEEGIPVNGMLWLLDRFIEHRILTAKEAAGALKAILAQGSWLPKKECEARLKKWSG